MPEYLTNTEKNWPTKAMFGVLVFFGVATLVLGTLSLGKNINLAQNNEVAIDNSQTVGAEETEKTIEELRAMDTDGDGLSDFNELYIYGTSPYLKDSDSDTFSDKEEIDGGFDPNCPKGQTCRGTTDETQNTINLPTGEAGKTQEEIESGAGGTQPVDGAQADGETRTLTPEEKAQLQQLTPAELRELLLSTGNITEEQLTAISDEKLMATVEEALGGQ